MPHGRQSPLRVPATADMSAASPDSANGTLRVLPVVSSDGARAELMLVAPESAVEPAAVLLWLPAMGVPARH